MPPSVAVICDAADPEGARVAGLLGAPVVPLQAPGGAARVEVVLVLARLDELWPVILRLAGWRSPAVVWAPEGEPPGMALPWWTRPVARILLRNQPVARRWGAHVPLGRLVVVEPGEPAAESAALRVVLKEVASMGRRGRA